MKAPTPSVATSRTRGRWSSATTCWWAARDDDLLVGDAIATLFHFPYEQNLIPPEPGGVPEIPVGLGLSGVGANDILDGGARATTS